MACESAVSTGLFCCLYGEPLTILAHFRAKNPLERMLTLFCNENFKFEAGFTINCPLCEVFFIAYMQTGTRSVSVVRSRGMSAIQGLLMY